MYAVFAAVVCKHCIRGCAIVAARPFLAAPARYQNPEMIIPEAFDDVQRLAYGFYAVFAASFASIATGCACTTEQKLAESRFHQDAAIYMR